MIGAEVFWARLASNGLIEHPTHDHADDMLSCDAKADDAAGEDIHEHVYPEASKQH